MKTYAGGFEGNKRGSKSMKRILLPSLFCLAVAATPAMADAPVMEILEPTGTVFVAGAGSVVSIKIAVQHNELKALTQFDVKVDASSILPAGQINPFTNTNQCSTDLVNASTACATTGLDVANVTVPWTVPVVPQTYIIFVKSRHQNVDGTDEEEVIVDTLSVEFPAPPAVANAYINGLPSATRKQFSGAVRGCVISTIAEGHAKNEAYGPKGGPYDIPLIQSDVGTLSPTCGGPAL